MASSQVEQPPRRSGARCSTSHRTDPRSASATLRISTWWQAGRPVLGECGRGIARRAVRRLPPRPARRFRDDMPKSFSGGCACGAIRYQVDAEPVLMVNCHCRACQRASGGAYGTGLIVRRGCADRGSAPLARVAGGQRQHCAARILRGVASRRSPPTARRRARSRSRSRPAPLKLVAPIESSRSTVRSSTGLDGRLRVPSPRDEEPVSGEREHPLDAAPASTTVLAWRRAMCHTPAATGDRPFSEGLTERDWTTRVHLRCNQTGARIERLQGYPATRLHARFEPAGRGRRHAGNEGRGAILPFAIRPVRVDCVLCDSCLHEKRVGRSSRPTRAFAH